MSVLPRTLRARLVLASLLLLPLSLGATGWYLERAHRQALAAGIAERLQLQVLALLAQAEFADDFELPLLPRESRLLQPGSGLYALVTDAAGAPLWLSPSATLLPRPLAALGDGLPALAPGERHTVEVGGLLRHAYQVLWETGPGTAVPLRFVVAASTAPLDADLAVYRKRLLLWLGGTLLLLLLTQLLIVHWGLRPLRRIAEEIARIERGERSQLPGPLLLDDFADDFALRKTTLKRAPFYQARREVTAAGTLAGGGAAAGG